MNIEFTPGYWLAVGMATIGYSAFSGIWHRQFVFGKKWEEAMGFNRPKEWKETTIYYVVPTLSCFTTSLTMTIILNLTGAKTLHETLTVALLIGVGFAMAVTFTNAVIPTMKKPLMFGLITGVAHVFGIVVVSLVLYILTK
jgi:Protein of unknown function (DUF1761)